MNILYWIYHKFNCIPLYRRREYKISPYIPINIIINHSLHSFMSISLMQPKNLFALKPREKTFYKRNWSGNWKKVSLHWLGHWSLIIKVQCNWLELTYLSLLLKSLGNLQFKLKLLHFTFLWMIYKCIN